MPASLFGFAFFAILFLQSGLDKAFNFESNLNWFRTHFSGSIFSPFARTMLVLLMIFELSSGLLSLYAFYPLCLEDGASVFLKASMLFNGLTLLMLFVGQRIAGDYSGAAVIAAYFAVFLLHMLLISDVLSL